MAPAIPGVGHSIATDSSSGFLLVSTYSWTVITLGTVLARFVQGVVLRKADLGCDDAAIIIASLFYLASTVSWQYSIDGGLGRNLDGLDDTQTTQLFKAFYIAVVLGVAAVAFGKYSTSCLIDRVSPQTRLAKAILFSIISTWTVFALFAHAFRCGRPRWDLGFTKCGDAGVVVAAIATNMTTDLLLAVWIIPTLWKLELKRDLRIMATVLFGMRALVPLVATTQIWTALKLARGSHPGSDLRDFAIATQAVTGMSLIVASIPRIKRCFAIGGSPLAVAEVQPNEIPIVRGNMSGRSPTIEPKLVPSDLGKSTATITSRKVVGGKTKESQAAGWQGMVSMGSTEDEDTSQSSLCNHEPHGGVMLCQEVTVSAEDRDIARAL